jgi:acyl transferase domain-containing protein/phosphopantetheinyl transferase
MDANARSSNRGDIAIIGMSCVFPGAEDYEQFWRNICGKLDQIGQPPPEWGAERYLNGVGPSRISTAAGGYLGDLYRFDPASLGVMPTAVDGAEPDQFLALKAARDALADAGYLREDYDHGNTGIVLGKGAYLHRGTGSMLQHGLLLDQLLSLLRELFPDATEDGLARLRQALLAKLPPFNADVAAGLVPNVLTGRITNRLNLRGPNYLIDAACASSLISVATAVDELRAGRCDMMLAGGVNASIPVTAYMVFTQLGALSPRSKVRPFDASADGTLLGEGLGIVVLKRVEDALAAGDRIYALIKAVGQSSDGRGAGLLAPQLDGEALAIRRAFGEAGVSPQTIDLMEAHGTGIPLGDRTEIAALRETFGSRQGDCPRVALGSVKSMIGHCIPAAGLAGLIKTALALYYRTLPPTLCDEVAPTLGVEDTPFYVNTEARPWVHPRGRRRRAGINAFGFGGVNSHAILEEAPEPARPNRPAYLPAELVVLAADSAKALTEKVARLRAGLSATLADAPLAALAAATAARDGGSGPARLAIVAGSTADLADKLGKAHERLAAGRGDFQIRSGVFAASAPRPGKLAFVFPGEGAQYPGMLGDVLMAFPEARRWYDFWDGLFADEPGARRSQSVFPPPTTLSRAAAERLEQALFGIERGSESVFIACHALLAVIERLGIVADGMLGHSGGEYAALSAAGVFGARDWDRLEAAVRELNRLYKGLEGADDMVAGGALLTVGAVPRERTLGLADGQIIHLALDNCRQQTVLYGPRPALERIAGELGREGGLCAFLPFDRPYHTPLFAPIAALVERAYEQLPFQSPAVPLYSCATAAPMPSSPQEVRKLAVEQWRSRVRFTETVQRMHADGYRTFVEVGPSSNLTGFIDNILQGEDALAIALDNRRRSSLEQLLQGVGRIWAYGRHVNLGALYGERTIPAVDLEAPARPPARARVFKNTLPFVSLSEDERRELRSALLPAATSQAEPRAAMPPHEMRHDAGEAAAPSALSAHFGLMQHFLHTQSTVMHAALGAQPQERAPTDQDADYPFLHRIVVHEADRLVAECDLDAGRDEFLRQHILYTPQPVSDLDPTLTSLPVSPMAVSLEMLIETAAALSGRAVPLRLEQIRALNWVSLDAGARTVVLTARLIGEANGETRVAARLADVDDVPLVEAEVVLGDSPPPAQPAQPAPLTSPRAPTRNVKDFYASGMFHGPLYHSVGTLLRWNESGLDAALVDTPLDGFIAPGRRPRFLINPLLLDSVGHVTAFWIAQCLNTDFSAFPSRIERIELFDAGRESTAGTVVSTRVVFDDDRRFLTAACTCIGADGHLLLRATGWRDRYFEVPSRFFFARYQPRDGFYGDDVGGLFANLPQDTLVWRVPAFPRGFLDDAGGIWRRVLGSTVLSAQERLEWEALNAPQRRRDEWLIGRIAIKEAARAWIERAHGVRLLPADVVVGVGENGKPYLSGYGLESFGPMPEISVAHVAGQAVAIAAPAGVPVGIDLESAGRIATSDLLAAGFSAAEQAILMDSGKAAPMRVLQAWCAKEAAAKCLGTGLDGAPKSFVVSALDDRQGWAHVLAGETALGVLLAVEQESVLAVAFGREAADGSTGPA